MVDLSVKEIKGVSEALKFLNKIADAWKDGPKHDWWFCSHCRELGTSPDGKQWKDNDGPVRICPHCKGQSLRRQIWVNAVYDIITKVRGSSLHVPGEAKEGFPDGAMARNSLFIIGLANILIPRMKEVGMEEEK